MLHTMHEPVSPLFHIKAQEEDLFGSLLPEMAAVAPCAVSWGMSVVVAEDDSPPGWS